MAARVLALLAAVAMIAGAVVLRNHRDHNGATSSASGGGLRITCATEVGDACDALRDHAATTVEPAGITAGRLIAAADRADIDAWIVPGPWAEIVDGARQRAGKVTLFKRTTAVASTRAGVAVFGDRRLALEKFCNGVSWKCLGLAAEKQTWKAIGGDESWGPVKLGIDDPTSSAAGLAGLGAAVDGYFGTGGNLSSANLDDDTFSAWLAAIAHAVPAATSLDRMVVVGPAVLDADIGLEAQIEPLVKSSQRKPEVIYPAPVGVVTVELAETSFQGKARQVVTADGVPALRATGWSPPAPANLPSAGVLDALRSAWKDAAR